LQIHRVPGLEPQSLEHGQKESEPDGNGRKDNVKAHREGELDAG